MDLNAVSYFLWVVQSGSFSAASKKSDIPVATLNRRVNELEKDLDVRLLERSTRHMRLTDAGQVFYGHALKGMESFDKAKLALQAHEQNLTGTLRISIPPDFLTWWELLRQFQQSYRNVKMDVLVSDKKYDLIAEDLDVALRVGEELHQSFVSRKISDSRHVLVASPDFVQHHGLPETPDDIIHFPCAGWKSKSDKLFWNLGGTTYDVRPYLCVNDYQHLKYLTLCGDCIAELPFFLARQEIADGLLVPVLSSYPFPIEKLTILYPSRKQLSRIISCFVDFCIANTLTYDYLSSME